MTLEELRNAVCRYIDENREAYNETGDECYRAVKEELLHILGLIDSVDHEPVGIPDKLTLTEAAHELRKLLNFGYVTLEASLGDYYQVSLWQKKPQFIDWCKSWTAPYGGRVYGWLTTNCLSKELDLSEYKDENGDIDYSKCIVEVE